MNVGVIDQLWRFPVKSMQGGRVEAFGCTGACPDDRMWAVVAVDGSRVLSAKRHPTLLEAAAALDDATGVITITLPDGSTHQAGDPATDAALSAWLDLDVRLAPRPPVDEPSPHYDMSVDPTDDTAAGFTFAGPPGTWVDLAAGHLLTTASLRAARELYPAGAWDVRRFRPSALLDLDAGLQGFVEDAWVGGSVALGAEVVMTPFMPTIRCAMPTRAQPGLDRDADISRTLRDHHGHNLGIYCAIERPGTLRVGDAVVVTLPS